MHGMFEIVTRSGNEIQILAYDGIPTKKKKKKRKREIPNVKGAVVMNNPWQNWSHILSYVVFAFFTLVRSCNLQVPTYPGTDTFHVTQEVGTK